ncbi:MAG TPA: hypothetical protein VK623_08785 [Flavobacterium sp.]|nr:hypothetical protein [Flavobacterium sp.]
MKKLLFLVLLFSAFASLAQETNIPVDSTKIEKKWDVTVDFASRYIWRGQAWGGNYIVAQPSFNYTYGNWVFGVWGTANFQKDLYADGTPNKGYYEIDLSVAYGFNDFLSFQVADYYWPTLEKMEGVDSGYFNYGSDGVKTVDAMLAFDFSDPESGYKYPFKAFISTFLAGNDYRYDGNGENPKQNFTTYLEAGYVFKNVLGKMSKKTFEDIDINPSVGAVLNNQAEYYTSGDYHGVSFVNLSIKASREFEFANGVTMPISLNYIHNAAKSNTEIAGNNFFTLGVSFYYEKKIN